MLNTKTFGQFVTRIFVGLVLTKAVIMPVVTSVKEISETAGAWSALHCSGLSITCQFRTAFDETDVVLGFVTDADYNLTIDTSEKRNLSGFPTIEQILGYLIFLALIWETPAIAFRLLNKTTQLLFEWNKAEEQRQLNLQKLQNIEVPGSYEKKAPVDITNQESEVNQL
jgi:hypothetical protein